jgi:ribosomal protein S8
MNLNNSVEAPKDTKQIKNAKYREKKKTTQPRNNIADEILAVLSMMNEHPFVQQVIHKKGQVPSIICHTEDQMVDFKHFLSRQGGTVGVDRTFNLGHFFVTTLVYKNHRVAKKDTKDPPCNIYRTSSSTQGCLLPHILFVFHLHCNRN